VELLINGKKKVIVNVDRIKPYRIQEATPVNKENSPKPPGLSDAPTNYEFDGEKFVPSQDTNDSMTNANDITPVDHLSPPLKNNTPKPPEVPEQRKRGRPRKVDQAPLPNKRNKWSMEAQAPSTSRMTT
jgi:hypothetical protein